MAPFLGLIDTSFTTKISADTKNIIFTNIQKYSKKNNFDKRIPRTQS